MDFFVDLDNIEESPNHFVHMVAGSIAGIMEHCGMFPLDTIRTHQQSLLAHGAERVPITYTVRSIVQRGGYRALFRGLPIMAASVGPIHGLSFTVYEMSKVVLGANKHGYHPISAASAGVCATLVHDACLTPIDLVKQRLQRGAVEYRGVGDAVYRGYKLHGVRGFYAGYTTALAMNLPFGAVYYGAYETLKKTFSSLSPSSPTIPSASPTNTAYVSPVVHMLAGAGAGAAAGAVTNPMDVAKTRLQVGTDLGRKYSGMVRTVHTIYKEEGLSAFGRGIFPRMLVHSMSAAMLWTTYEYVKKAMG